MKKQKQLPGPGLGQAVQSPEHHQHGHQRHNGQHRLHPAPVFRHGDVRDPGVEGGVVGGGAEEGHDAVQHHHQHRRAVGRTGQGASFDEGEGPDADAPQQIADDDQGLPPPQPVAEGPHHQGGDGGGDGAPGHHGGDHGRVPGDGVVQEHVEIHILNDPGDLSEQAEGQQGRPGAAAQSGFHVTAPPREDSSRTGGSVGGCRTASA